MKHKIKAVAEFHDAFEIGNNFRPVNIQPKEAELRFNLMKEENEEYLAACKDNDLIEIADALGDQLYILCGTMLRHGLQEKIDAVFEEIHRSNMSKLDANGKPIHRADGKVMKSAQYFKPDIAKILGDSIHAK